MKTLGISAAILLVGAQANAAQDCYTLTQVSGGAGSKPAELCIARESSGGNYELKVKQGNKIFVHYKQMKKSQLVPLCLPGGPCPPGQSGYAPDTVDTATLFNVKMRPDAQDRYAGTCTFGGGLAFKYRLKGAPPPAAGTCKKGGCSGQLCYDPATGSGISTCEFRPEYACYRTAECKKQSDGKCGWTQSAALLQCISNAGNN